MTAARQHGTVAGHAQHRRRGEQPCESCRQALNEYTRLRHLAAPEAHREANRRYRLTHPEAVAESLRAWKEAHPERVAEHDERHKQRMRDQYQNDPTYREAKLEAVAAYKVTVPGQLTAIRHSVKRNIRRKEARYADLSR